MGTENRDVSSTVILTSEKSCFLDYSLELQIKARYKPFPLPLLISVKSLYIFLPEKSYSLPNECSLPLTFQILPANSPFLVITSLNQPKYSCLIRHTPIYPQMFLSFHGLSFVSQVSLCMLRKNLPIPNQEEPKVLFISSATFCGCFLKSDILLSFSLDQPQCSFSSGCLGRFPAKKRTPDRLHPTSLEQMAPSSHGIIIQWLGRVVLTQRDHYPTVFLHDVFSIKVCLRRVKAPPFLLREAQ